MTVRPGSVHRSAIRFTAVLAGLAAGLPATSAMARTSATTVTAKDNGHVASVPQGTDLRIVLTGSFASTGYHWVLSGKPNASILKTIGGGKVSNDGKCAAMETGCLEKITFTFAALHKPGRTTIRLTEFPPGRGRKAAGKFVIHVSVPPVVD